MAHHLLPTKRSTPPPHPHVTSVAAAPAGDYAAHDYKKNDEKYDEKCDDNNELKNNVVNVNAGPPLLVKGVGFSKFRDEFIKTRNITK